MVWRAVNEGRPGVLEDHEMKDRLSATGAGRAGSLVYVAAFAKDHK